MAFKFVVFAAFVAVTRAGLLPAYSSPLAYAAPAVAKVAYSPAPAVSYSSVSSPLIAKVAAPVAYASPAVSYASPALSYASPALSYASPALSYSAPALKVAAPAVSYAPALSYAAPALKVAAPALSYASPALSYAAPALKVAAPVAYAAPEAKTIVAEPSAPAQYDFGYAVSDPHTGDSKSQQESRRGDAVQGSYSLIEADGSRRTVDYTADAHNGFNAVVRREPAAVHVKAVAPVAHGYAAPVAHGYAAPLVQGYAAPVSHGVVGPAYYH